MPLRNAETIISYPVLDSVTGDYTTDAASNHTYELLADGVEVAVTDTGSSTTVTGVNQVTIASGENTGVVMVLKITTSTSGIKIPVVSWDNDEAQPTVAQIADGVWDEATSGHTTSGTFGYQAKTVLDAVPTAAALADAVWDEAGSGHVTAGTFGYITQNVSGGSSAADIADAVWDEATSGHSTTGTFGAAIGGIGTTTSVINIPLVAYNGNMNLYSGNSYDGDLNPLVVIPSALTADLSGSTAHIKISSQENDQGTIYYEASDGTISGSTGAWSVSYEIPTSGTTSLPLGVQSCFYHCYVVDGTAVATVGKGKVNVK